MCHYLFEDKIIQNCLKIDTTHYYDNGLLQDKKIKKKTTYLEADIITIKTKTDLISLAQRMYLLQNVLQITAIAIVEVIYNGKIYEKQLVSTCLIMTRVI